MTGGSLGTATGPQRWPDAICPHQQICFRSCLRGHFRALLRTDWRAGQRLTRGSSVHEDKVAGLQELRQKQQQAGVCLLVLVEVQVACSITLK